MSKCNGSIKYLKIVLKDSTCVNCTWLYPITVYSSLYFLSVFCEEPKTALTCIKGAIEAKFDWLVDLFITLYYDHQFI